MKLLIVEDDHFKYSRVAQLIKTVLDECQIIHFDNVHGAVCYLASETPDKIILDMSLPSHPAVAGQGSPVPMPSGGVELILELRSLSKTRIPVIVLTQYPNVEVEYEYYSIHESGKIIRELYDIATLEVLYYEHEGDQWQDKLAEFLEN